MEVYYALANWVELHYPVKVYDFQPVLSSLCAMCSSSSPFSVVLPPTSDVRTVLLCELQSLVEDSDIEASNRLLGASQVSLLFGVCERTVRFWASKKQIPAMRTPSGRWKFPLWEFMNIYKTGLQTSKE